MSIAASAPPAARRWRLAGHVQGVGYRPFVYRLAQALGVRGWVRNETGTVLVHGEANPDVLARFGRDLVAAAPAIAAPRVAAEEAVALEHCTGFVIQDSRADPEADIHLPPDYHTCADCRRELGDPADRRYRYPFINCTQCGPRYTLIAALPYDRASTSMAGFPLCPECAAEYRDPRDRRFHAEPVACPACGPRLTWVGDGDPGEPLAAAVTTLNAGGIVAVKGVGGYHLLCAARDPAAVARLRARKPRPHKPLAVMFPETGDDGLAAVRPSARVDAASGDLLRSPRRPIVLLPRRADCPLAPDIAPGLAEIGAMLPYSPLHHLLLEDVGAPLVATSGNVSGEPVLTDPGEAERRLARVADGFLHHDRPILRPADDSVFRPLSGQPRPLRLGRGTAPLELELPAPVPRPLVAVGAHMKNTVALAWGRRVVLSPHIGDMGTPRSLQVFEQVVADLQAIYGVTAEALACDAHPGYTTRRWAEARGLPLTRVFHHHAHAAALTLEHPGAGDWLVFAWDGVGYGEDGTLWGGEALWGRPGAWERVGRLRPFRLPGGDRAARQPWRSALALAWESGQPWLGAPTDTALLRAAWDRGLNAPLTTAAGRLFDAAAALTGLCLEASFEGQGPMLLEAAWAAWAPAAAPEVPVTRRQGLWEIDWAPLVPPLQDPALPVAVRSALFHGALAEAIARLAGAVSGERPVDRVGLTGGVFQNRVLTEQASAALAARGFPVRIHRRTPPNDAAIALGQVVEVSAVAGDR